MKIPSCEKLSSGNYRCRLRLKGYPTISITRPSKKECLDECKRVKGRWMAGLPYGDTDPSDITLSQAIDNYIDGRTLSPSTIRGYRGIQKQRFQQLMNHKLPIDEQTWRSAIKSEKCNGKTLKNSFLFLKSVCSSAGYTVPEIKLPQVITNEKPILTVEQIPIFLEAIKDTHYELVALFGLHSLRLSETLAITWDDIDLKNKRIHVNGARVRSPEGMVTKKENKNVSSNRIVPIIIPRLYELLKHGGTGRILDISNGNHAVESINKICKKNGLPQVGSHGLRHSFCSLAFSDEINLPIKTVMAIGGWSDTTTMLRIYTHVKDRDINKAAEKLTQFYLRT